MPGPVSATETSCPCSAVFVKRDVYFALRRSKLDRITDQICKHLGDLVAVRPNGYGFVHGWTFETNKLLFCRRSQVIRNFIEEFVKRKMCRFELSSALFDNREIEHDR